MKHSVSLEQRLDTDLTESLYRWMIPVALLLCVILAFFDKVSIAALFSDQTFLTEMQLIQVNGKPDGAKLGLLMTSFLLAYGFSSTFLSFIGDLISPIKLLVMMMVSWGVIMFCMAYSLHYYHLLLGRILLGITEGPLFAVAYTIVKRNFKAHEQARASMVWLLGTPIGASIGFPVTLLVMEHFGWRATFLVMASLTLLVIIVAYYLLWFVGLTRANGVKREQDAMTSLSQPKLSFSEHVAASYSLWKSPLFWLICLFNVALLGYLWGMNTWLLSYLKETRQLDIVRLSLFSSLPFIAMLVGEVSGAFISDRYGRRALMCLIAVLGAGIGLLIVILASHHVVILFALAFSMFCWGLAPPSVFPLLSKVVDARVSATAGGIFNGLGNFASALIPWMIGIMVVYFNNMDIVIWVLAVISLVGGLALIPHVIKRL